MPNIDSARKRMRQSEKKRQSNRTYKSKVKTSLKNLEQLIAQGDKKSVAQLQPQVQKVIDQAQATGIYKKNTASRIKSKMMRQVNTLT